MDLTPVLYVNRSDVEEEEEACKKVPHTGTSDDACRLGIHTEHATHAHTPHTPPRCRLTALFIYPLLLLFFPSLASFLWKRKRGFMAPLIVDVDDDGDTNNISLSLLIISGPSFQGTNGRREFETLRT
jgi:hypothetical protein